MARHRSGAAPVELAWICVQGELRFLADKIWELYTVPTYPGRVRCSVIAEEFTYAGRSEPCLVLGML